MQGFVDIDRNDLFTVDCDHVRRGHDKDQKATYTVVNARFYHFSQGVIYIVLFKIVNSILFLPLNAVCIVSIHINI